MALLKVFYKCCCGIDVHRSIIKANLRRVDVKDVFILPGTIKLKRENTG